MSQPSIDPAVAFEALRRFVAKEVSRLYGEIAARDALIEELQRLLDAASQVPDQE